MQHYVNECVTTATFSRRTNGVLFHYFMITFKLEICTAQWPIMEGGVEGGATPQLPICFSLTNFNGRSMFGM